MLSARERRMGLDFQHLYFSTDGRIGRQSWWIGLIGVIIAGIVLSIILGLIIGQLWGNFITTLLLAYPYYALLAKRFQDRDQPGTYAAIPIGLGLLSTLLGAIGLTGTPESLNVLGIILGVIGVIVGIWVLVVCGFLRGTVGANTYGPDPLEPSAAA
jgi:uncharacterized membrane protein YhaH (DUF805 family)